jgi:hypothetical protein
MSDEVAVCEVSKSLFDLISSFDEEVSYSLVAHIAGEAYVCPDRKVYVIEDTPIVIDLLGNPSLFDLVEMDDENNFHTLEGELTIDDVIESLKLSEVIRTHFGCYFNDFFNGFMDLLTERYSYTLEQRHELLKGVVQQYPLTFIPNCYETGYEWAKAA